MLLAVRDAMVPRISLIDCAHRSLAVSSVAFHNFSSFVLLLRHLFRQSIARVRNY